MKKTALITGGAKRIGADIARSLHAAEMNIIVHYNHSESEAGQLVEELNRLRPGSAKPVQADLAKHDSYQTLFESALGFKGQIDVLINNASVFYPTSITEITNEDWGKIIDINLKASLFLSQCFARHANKHGVIINIADIHAERPLKGHTIYSISQAGMIMLTKSLARELGPEIRVNAISPGAILWPENMDEEIKKSILEKVTLNKTGTGKDISEAVLFLIEQADYITGQIVTIDGGRTLFS